MTCPQIYSSERIKMLRTSNSDSSNELLQAVGQSLQVVMKPATSSISYLLSNIYFKVTATNL